MNMESVDVPLESHSQEIVTEEETVAENFLNYPENEVPFTVVSPMKVCEMTVLYSLPAMLFPVFEVTHYTITALSLRQELGRQFSVQSPLASCLSMVISCTAGSLMSRLLLGLPPGSALENDWTMLMMVTVWASLNFSPGDVVYKLVRQQQVYSLLWSIKEVHRMRKIVAGVDQVEEKYPGSLILSTVVGVLRGNGTTIIRPVVRMMCGVNNLDNELLQPGLSTKMCIVATLVWILTVDTALASYVYTTAVLTFLLVRLIIILQLSGSSLLERLGFISINDNDQVMETETETENQSQSDKKDA